jgi:predicted ATPase
LKILVTSRVRLSLRGEHEFCVPPLELPDPCCRLEVSTLSHYAAIELFIQRAQAAKSDFSVTNATVPALAEICRRLDGLPLAIELAAARMKLFSPQALLARLGSRLKLLTGGPRDLPARQQTLRNTVAWSHDLLDEDERKLFRRLSTFIGGFTLSAAEIVCKPDGDWHTDVLEGVTSLTEKSMVRAEEGEDGQPRFTMLETIREFATECLEASGEAERTRREHARCFLNLAEQAEPYLWGPEHVAWLHQFEVDHDNHRASLTWFVERGEAEPALRLATTLAAFWRARGYLTEGRERVAAVLALGGGSRAARAKTLNAAGGLASDQADYTAAWSLCHESLAIHRELGDRRGIASSLHSLGIVASERADYAAAQGLYEESLAIQRELGNRKGIATSLCSIGNIAYDQEDYAAAGASHEESLQIFRALGDRQGIACTLNSLAAVAKKQGDYGTARARDEESLAIQRELGNQQAIAVVLSNLGLVAQEQKEHEAARRFHEESRAIRRELGNQLGIAYGLEGLAAVASAQGELERAARLFGAAEALREALGTPLPPSEHAKYERQVAAARAGLSEGAFAAAWTEGRAMCIEKAINDALEGSS